MTKIQGLLPFREGLPDLRVSDPLRRQFMQQALLSSSTLLTVFALNPMIAVAATASLLQGVQGGVCPVQISVSQTALDDLQVRLAQIR